MSMGAFPSLLAQVYREDFARGFRSATSQLHWTDVIPYVIALALLIFIAWLAPYLRRRNDMSERCDDPQKLFRELCLAHELDRSSRRLLLRLVEANRLAQPGQVFLTPMAFEPSRLPASLRERLDEVKQLRARLF
jgi:hypothetical protein